MPHCRRFSMSQPHLLIRLTLFSPFIKQLEAVECCGGGDRKGERKKAIISSIIVSLQACLYDGGLCPLSLACLSLQAFWGSGVSCPPLSRMPFLIGLAVFFLSPEIPPGVRQHLRARRQGSLGLCRGRCPAWGGGSSATRCVQDYTPSTGVSGVVVHTPESSTRHLSAPFPTCRKAKL